MTYEQKVWEVKQLAKILMWNNLEVQDEHLIWTGPFHRVAILYLTRGKVKAKINVLREVVGIHDPNLVVTPNCGKERCCRPVHQTIRTIGEQKEHTFNQNRKADVRHGQSTGTASKETTSRIYDQLLDRIL